MVRFERQDIDLAGKAIALGGTVASAATYVAASDGSLTAIRHGMAIAGVTGSASAISAGLGALAITALAMAYYTCAKAIVGEKRADDWIDRRFGYTAQDGTHRLRKGSTVLFTIAALGSASLGGAETHRALCWFLPPDNHLMSKTEPVTIPQSSPILPTQDDKQFAVFPAPEIKPSPSMRMAINSDEAKKRPQGSAHASKIQRPSKKSVPISAKAPRTPK